ncbi:MAG: hypothetical protein HYY17_06750 [Planctomycetes bacterium]|nr:hypothetical protein [Planctomycetota bacterium]
MAAFWTDKFSFSTGAVRYRDLAYLILTNDALAEDRVAYSILATWDPAQPWYQIQNKWTCPSVCVVKHPKEQGVAIGEMGEAYVTGRKDDHEETVADGKLSPQTRGTLRCVRAVEGKAYAAGMHRQVYRRDDRDKWTCIDETMRPPAGSEDVVGFEAIDGFSAKDLYAVGWEGEIWHYDGRAWKQADSPTNAILTNVCCAGDGKVYACGGKGLLVRGRGADWEVVDHEDTKQDFWGFAWFGERLHLSSTRSVWVLDGDHLQRVKMGEDIPETCYHLSAADGVLWSIGAKDVMAFDGKNWTRID